MSTQASADERRREGARKAAEIRRWNKLRDGNLNRDQLIAEFGGGPYAERQAEVLLVHRERVARHKMIVQMIDTGRRAMATKLHPDVGGSTQAMERLNLAHDDLIAVLRWHGIAPKPKGR